LRIVRHCPAPSLRFHVFDGPTGRKSGGWDAGHVQEEKIPVIPRGTSPPRYAILSGCKAEKNRLGNDFLIIVNAG
jgi:hypothetical protein